MDFYIDYDGEKFDFKIENNDIKTDDGLRSAVIISLFTDRRAGAEEVPAEDPDRRGWWGDMVPELKGDQIGSKLWLLAREKQTEETRKRFQEYAQEALAWMIEDNLAQSVTVEAEWISQGFLALKVSIQQPKGTVAFKFKINWAAELSRAQ